MHLRQILVHICAHAKKYFNISHEMSFSCDSKNMSTSTYEHFQDKLACKFYQFCQSIVRLWFCRSTKSNTTWNKVEIELLGLQVPEFWQSPGAGVGNKSLYWAPQW